MSTEAKQSLKESKRRAGACRGLGRDDFLHDYCRRQSTEPAAPGMDVCHPARHRASLAHFSLWNHGSYRLFDIWGLRKSSKRFGFAPVCTAKGRQGVAATLPRALLHRAELSWAQKIQAAANAGLKPWLFIPTPGQKLKSIISKDIGINPFSICRTRVLYFDTNNWSRHQVRLVFSTASWEFQLRLGGYLIDLCEQEFGTNWGWWDLHGTLHNTSRRRHVLFGGT